MAGLQQGFQDERGGTALAATSGWPAVVSVLPCRDCACGMGAAREVVRLHDWARGNGIDVGVVVESWQGRKLPVNGKRTCKLNDGGKLRIFKVAPADLWEGRGRSQACFLCIRVRRGRFYGTVVLRQQGGRAR